jgi:hypothetical protein
MAGILGFILAVLAFVLTWRVSEFLFCPEIIGLKVLTLFLWLN